MGVNGFLIVAWWMYYVRVNRQRDAAFIASGMSMEEKDHLNKLAGETDGTDLRGWLFNAMVASLMEVSQKTRTSDRSVRIGPCLEDSLKSLIRR
jgi:hypothetical protein